MTIKITKKDKEKLVSLVAHELRVRYHLNDSECSHALEHSAFIKMLACEPEYVFHYPIDYWAEDVLAETVDMHVS